MTSFYEACSTFNLNWLLRKFGDDIFQQEGRRPLEKGGHPLAKGIPSPSKMVGILHQGEMTSFYEACSTFNLNRLLRKFADDIFSSKFGDLKKRDASLYPKSVHPMAIFAGPRPQDQLNWLLAD